MRFRFRELQIETSKTRLNDASYAKASANLTSLRRFCGSRLLGPVSCEPAPQLCRNRYLACSYSYIFANNWQER